MKIELISSKEPPPTPFLSGYGLSCGDRLVEVDLELSSGKTYALLGPNGSGKSTLLRIMSGIVSRADGAKGIIKHIGTRAGDYSFADWTAIVRYVPSTIDSAFEVTAFDYVDIALEISHRRPGLSRSLRDDQVMAAMMRCHCWELRRRKLSDLSHGERSRVLLASAIAAEPKILLLDETLSSTDPNFREALSRVLTEYAHGSNRCVVLVTHDLVHARAWADEWICLSEGRMLAQGSAANLDKDNILDKLFVKI